MDVTASRTRAHRVLRIAGRALGGIAAVAFVVLIIRDVTSRIALRRAEAVVSALPDTEPLDRAPVPALLSDAARSFARLWGSLPPPFGTPREDAATSVFREKSERVIAWSQGWLRSDESIAEPPPSVSDALRELEPVLDEWRAAWQASSPTTGQWPDAFERWSAVRVARLFLASAARSLAADEDRATADLDLAWSLGSLLLQQEDSVFRGLGAGIRRECLVAVRKWPAPPGTWRARCTVEPTRVAYRDSLVRDCHELLMEARKPPATVLISPPRWTLGWALLQAPIVRRGVALEIDARQDTLALLNDPVRCGPSSWLLLEPSGKWPGEETPIHGPYSYGFLVPRLDLARLDAELTAIVLDARAGLVAPSDEIPSSCPDVTFRVSAEPDGTIHVRAESPQGPWWEHPHRGTRLSVRLSSLDTPRGPW